MGKDPFSDRIENAKKIGVVFGQKTQLWWDIPVEETFRLLKKIYEIPEEQYIKNMEKFSNILGAAGIYESALPGNFPLDKG